jgi:hypothetical protein
MLAGTALSLQPAAVRHMRPWVAASDQAKSTNMARLWEYVHPYRLCASPPSSCNSCKALATDSDSVSGSKPGHPRLLIFPPLRRVHLRLNPPWSAVSCSCSRRNRFVCPFRPRGLLHPPLPPSSAARRVTDRTQVPEPGPASAILLLAVPRLQQVSQATGCH